MTTPEEAVRQAAASSPTLEVLADRARTCTACPELVATRTQVVPGVVPYLTRGMRARPSVFERGRKLGTDLAFVLARHGAFGSRDVSPSLVQFVERMTAATPVDVIAEFYDTFTTHDKLAALEVLRDVETLVLVGSKDLITPLDHSEAMADAVPSATFVVVEGAGHMVQLERAALVTLQLRRLVARATARGRSSSRSA